MAVIIDIGTRADSAQKDLDSLNRSLAKLVTSSNSSNKALGGISTNSFKNINKALESGNIAFDSFGKSGRNALTSLGKSADNTIVHISKLRSTVSKGFSTAALTSLKTILLDVTKRFGAFGEESKKSLDGINIAATKTTNKVSSLKSTVIGLSAAFLGLKGVSFFNQTADELTNLQNRLKLVIKNTDELNRAQRKLYEISKDTRTEFKNSVQVFTDFARAGEKFGLSQDKILGLTKTINQAAALSGSSAEAVSAALTQLSQGLSSGTLAGDELRSVLEQLPYLGQKLAEQMGMTTGQLKKFASEGTLGPKTVMDAISRMAKSTQKDFDLTTATAEQAVKRLGMSFNYMLGELNKALGISDSFARKLINLSNAVDIFSANLQDAASIFSQNIKNYLNEFDKFSAAELTLKTLIKLEITPDEIYNKYQTYRATKKYIKAFRDLFGMATKSELQKPVVISPNVDVAQPSDPNIDLGVVKKLAEKQKLINALRLSIKVTVDNILGMIPQIRGPVQTLGSLFSQVFGTLLAEVNALIYDGLMPLNRSLESVAERLSLWSRGDNALSRAWVNLFQSKNLIDFRKNLDELNFQRQSKSLGDMDKTLTRLKAAFGVIVNPIQTTLVFLNLLDNQLVRIQQSRLNRIIDYFTDLGKVSKRVYQDVFATTLEPKFIAMMLSIKAVLGTFADALLDTFSTGTGQRLADNFLKGIDQLPIAISKLFADIKSSDIFEGLFRTPDKNGIQNKLGSVLNAIFDFIKGFFGTVGEAVANSAIGNSFDIFRDKFVSKIKSLKSFVNDIKKDVSDKIFSFKLDYAFSFDNTPLQGMFKYFLDLFERIQTAASTKLKKTENLIKTFSKNIKDYFFDIYDKVVGHSYWPDMIDGVNAYTKNIFESKSTIERFKESIKGIFKALFAEIVSMGNQMGGAFAIFVNKLSYLDVTSVVKTIGEKSGASFLAGLLYSFGSNKVKLVAIAYFVSLADSAFSGAITAIAPNIATALGASAGAMVGGALAGAKTILNTLIDAFPGFMGKLISSLIDSVIPMGDVFTGLIGKFEIFQNSVLHGIILIGAAYGLLTKKGFSNISDILFGKTNKKTKVKSDGVVDYITAAFRGNSTTSKVGTSFFDKAFNSKKLAVIAAGIFSTAMLESVSIVEAAQIGVPLLAYAIMGKDGGGKVLRSALTMVNLFGSTALTAITHMLGMERITFNLLRSVIPTRPATQTAFRIAGDQLFDSFKQMVINLRSNSTRYATGRFSLTDALLTTNQPRVQGRVREITRQTRLMPQSAQVPIQRTRIPLVAQIKNVADEFKLTEAGKNLTEGFATLRTNIKSGFDSLVGFFRGSTFFSSLKTFTTDIFKGIGSIIASVYRNVKTGISGIIKFAMLNSKILIGAFLLLGSTAALAASDANTAFSSFADNLIFVSKGVTALILSLAALGYAIKVYTVFKAEGFIAALKYIGSSLSWIKSFGIGLVDIIKNKFFSAVWWNSIGPVIGRNLKLSPGLMIQWQGLAAGIATASREFQHFGIIGKFILLQVWAIAFGLDGVRLSLLTVFEVFKKLPLIIMASMGPTGALGKIFLGLSGAINTLITSAIAGFGMLIKTVLSALKSMAIAAAPWILIPAAIGAIGLFFFGPGNNFVDRLEWAYDKVRSIFGLESKTKFGRMQELTKATKPIMMGKNIADIQSAVSNIDTSKQTEPQFAVLKEAASSTMAGLKDLQATYIKQGFVSQEMLTEWNKLVSDFKKIASHQPQDDTKKPKSMQELASDLLTVETSSWDLAKAMLGIKPVFDATIVKVGSFRDIWSKTMNWIIATVSSGLSIIGNFFSAIWTTVKASIGAGILVGLGTYITNLVVAAFGGIITTAALPEAGIAAMVVGLASLAYNLAPVIASTVAWIGSILQLDDAIDWLSEKLFGIKDASFKIGEGVASFWGALEPDFIAGYDGIVNHTGDFFDEIKNRISWKLDWLLKATTGKDTQQRVDEAQATIDKQNISRHPRLIDIAVNVSNTHIAENTQFISDPALKATAEKAVDAYRAASKTFKTFDIGYKPENNSAGANSAADFGQKEAAAYMELAKATDQLMVIDKVMLPIALADKKIKEFSDSFTLLGEDMKNVLAIDMGTNFKDFLGYSKDIDIFKASVEEVRGIDKDLSFTWDFEKKGQLERQKASIIKRMTDMVATIKAHADKYGTIDLTLNTQATLLGNTDSKDAIAGLQKYHAEAYKAFSEITKSIEQMQQEQAGLSPEIESSSKRYNQLKDDIQKAQDTASKMLPKSNWLDAINDKLQTIGADQLSIFSYKSIDPKGLENLGISLEDLVSKQKDYNILKKDNPEDLKGLMAKYEIISNLTDKIKEDTKQISTKALVTLINSPATTGEKVKQFTKETGSAPPTAVMQKGLAEPFMKMTAAKNLLQLKIEANDLTTSLEDAGATMAGYDIALGKMAEVTTTTLSSLLSSFSDIGISIDNLSFSRLSNEARTFLSDVGIQLESVNKLISENPFADNVTLLVKKQEELLLSAADTLLAATYKTGAGIDTALGRIGISDTKAIAYISGAQIAGLLEMDKAAEKARILVSKASSPEDYLDKLKAFSTAAMSATQEAEKVVNGFEKNLSNVNEIFKTSLDGLDLLSMAPNLAKGAMDLARSLKNELETAMANNLPTIDILSRIKDAADTGALLTLFKDMSTGMADAIKSGARNGFAKIKSVYADSKLTLKQFVNMEPAKRREMTQQAVAQESFKKATELPSLTNDQVDILNKVASGSSIKDVMDEFSKSFPDVLKTTNELLITSQDSLNTSVKDLDKTSQTLRDAFLGKATTDTKANSLSSIKDAILRVESSGGLEKQVNRSSGTVGQMQAKISTLRDPGVKGVSRFEPAMDPKLTPKFDPLTKQLTQESYDILKQFVKDNEQALRDWGGVYFEGLVNKYDDVEKALKQYGGGSTYIAKIDKAMGGKLTAPPEPTPTEKDNKAKSNFHGFNAEGVPNMIAKAVPEKDLKPKALLAVEAATDNFSNIISSFNIKDFKAVLEGMDGFDQRIVNLASNADLEKASTMAVKIAKLETDLTKAMADKQPTQAIQTNIQKLKEQLMEIPAAITAAADAAKAAGESFSSDVMSTFKDGLKGFAKGKVTLSELKTTALDSITSSIVDTFIDGLVQPFEKKGGDMIKSLGSSIFGLGQGIFGEASTTKGADTTDPTAAPIVDNATQNADRIIAAILGGGVGNAASGMSDLFSKGLSSFSGDAASGFTGMGAFANMGGYDPVSGLTSNMGQDMGMLGNASSWWDSNPVAGGTGGGFGGSSALSMDSMGFGGMGAGGAGSALPTAPIDTSWLDTVSTSIGDTFTGLFGDTGSLTTLFSGFGKGATDMFGGIFDSIMGLFSGGGSGGGAGGLMSGIMSIGSLFLADGGVAGKVSGSGTGTSDSIPAMLSNGEFVINAKAAKANFGLVSAINSGTLPKFATGGFIGIPKFATGGLVNPELNMTPTSTIDPSKANKGVQGNSQVINLQITGDISRQTKSEVYKMLPQIAQGVNGHNKEKGYKG